MSYSNNVVEVDFDEYLATLDLYNISFSVDKTNDSVSIEVDYDSIVNLLANVDNLNCSAEDIVDVEFVEGVKNKLVITLEEDAETYDPDYEPKEDSEGDLREQLDALRDRIDDILNQLDTNKWTSGKTSSTPHERIGW